jgi:hypothetical protein
MHTKSITSELLARALLVVRLRRIANTIEDALVEAGCDFRGAVEERHRALAGLLDQSNEMIDREATR